MPSRDARTRTATARWLLEKELRELTASRAYWLMLLVIGALVGEALITSVNLYAEASGIGGGPAALSQGLSPLEGIVVPVLGAYDIAVTLLFPFVVIRLVAMEKQTGELALTLQGPAPLGLTIAAKAIALLLGWLISGVAGALAMAAWSAMGGHLYWPELLNVALGHLLRGVLTIGIAAAAAALAASAASAAIIALTVTLGTWALDYVAAARGGVLSKIAEYTPSAALRVFEHGELRVATVLILTTLGIAGLAVAAVWLDEGRRASVRATRLAVVVVLAGAACVAWARIRASRDVSEDRRNSFPPADENALRAIRQPLHVTVYLAAEDPRLTDLERGVLAKLRRTMRSVQVTYSASSRSGLFEHGELRVATVLILTTLGIAGLAVAAVWLDEGRRGSARAARLAAVIMVAAAACVACARIRASRDVSEDRRNSFPPADEHALRAIREPLHVTVYLAAEDPRLTDLERGVLAKLRRTMRSVQVTYSASSRSGLFERPNEHYGEVWYDLGGRREMTRSTTEPIVLETIYRLAGRAPPAAVDTPPYPGYPLAARSTAAPWLFFVIWPVSVLALWWWLRRAPPRRPQFAGD